MICHLTKLKVADNSGALIVECIKILSGKKSANISDEILVTIQKRMPLGNNTLKEKRRLKRGSIVHRIVVRTKTGIIRPNGLKIQFNDNAVVLFSRKNENLLGSRIIGPVTLELRKWNFLKILSLTQPGQSI
jgi:large subunit ribosomal protein L14